MATPIKIQQSLKYWLVGQPKAYCTIKQIENYILHTIKAYFIPQVEEWIAQMEKFVEQETGRIFVAKTTATERKYDGDGGLSLFLDESVAVSKLTIDSTVIGASDYLVYPANKLPITRIKLKDGAGFYFTKGEQNIKVEAKWGHSVDCPSDISFATMILVVGIINFSGEMKGEIKQERIGDYSVTYKNQKDWQDFERAKGILLKNKLIVVG